MTTLPLALGAEGAMMPFRPDWLDGRTTQAHRWFARAPHRMRHGKLDEVLADLTDILDVEVLPAAAQDILTVQYSYMGYNSEHINPTTTLRVLTKFAHVESRLSGRKR